MMQKSALKVGVDVPWVTSWTGEVVLGVRPCASVGGALAIVQADDAGIGKPLYSQNHAVRQRLSVNQMLCPMCGRPTTADDRWTQVAHPVAAGTLRQGRQVEGLPAEVADDQILIDAGAIAPLHRACVDRSLKYCPHLKADPNIDVRRFPERWLVLPLLVRAEAPPQMFLARAQLARAVAVVGFLQLVGLTGERDPDWRKRPRVTGPSSP
jgi:hypothetical protein